jgi:hypothetical protein
MAKKATPLVIFGCIHIGMKDADLTLAQRYVNFVKNNDGLALLLADNHECAVPRKAHMMYEQNISPQEQLEYGIEMFRPIRKQIIGACTGNHALRARKETSLDMDKIMADELGYIHRYHPYQGFVAPRIGKHEYRIAFKHGSGTGHNIFLNCMQLLRSYPGADICASSHLHKNALTVHGYWDVQDGARVIHPVFFVTTGATLNFPRYADEAGYPPQPKGFPILWLGRDEFRIKADLVGEV